MYQVERVGLPDTEYLMNLNNALDQILSQCNQGLMRREDKNYDQPKESLADWSDGGTTSTDSSSDKSLSSRDIPHWDSNEGRGSKLVMTGSFSLPSTLITD